MPDSSVSQNGVPRRWTIAVISPYDPDVGEYDELFENVATVEAETEEEAIRLYGEEHPYHRDHWSVYARPEGEPW